MMQCELKQGGCFSLCLACLLRGVAARRSENCGGEPSVRAQTRRDGNDHDDNDYYHSLLYYYTASTISITITTSTISTTVHCHCYFYSVSATNTTAATT